MASPAKMKPIAEALSMHESAVPGVYEAYVLSDYCYGDCEAQPRLLEHLALTDRYTGAWGGLPASLVHTAATRFAARDDLDSRYPDVVNMQIQYLRPILRKEITISVHVARVTKLISTVHVAVAQDGKDCVVGYVNLSNLQAGKGPTLDTKWQIHPAPAPANLKELETNTSNDWIRYSVPYSQDGWYRLQSMVHWFLPIRSTLPSMSEAWLTLTDPRNAFTNDTLGMVADLWPPWLDSYNPNSSISPDKLVEIAKQQKSNPNGTSELADTLHAEGFTSPFIMTTLSLTLEVKKRLPASGVKWLYVRAYAKAVEQGRCDVEVLIMDEGMELVALSHHMVLAAVFRPERRDKSMFGVRAKV